MKMSFLFSFEGMNQKNRSVCFGFFVCFGLYGSMFKSLWFSFWRNIVFSQLAGSTEQEEAEQEYFGFFSYIRIH